MHFDTPTSVRVKVVDLYGYLGRDNHPRIEDRGTTLRVLRLESVPFEGIANEDGTPYVETILYCVRPDGSLVDMMDFEVEPVISVPTDDAELPQAARKMWS